MNILDVQNLTLSFGENTLFSNLSFDIGEKDKVGFVGVNGAGKTSLFKIITGEYTADSGNCFISKNATLGYMEQHTCSNDKTIWNELVSVYSDLIEMELELDDLSEKLKTNHSKELIDRQDYLTNEFTQNGGLTISRCLVLLFWALVFARKILINRLPNFQVGKNQSSYLQSFFYQKQIFFCLMSLLIILILVQ